MVVPTSGSNRAECRVAVDHHRAPRNPVLQVGATSVAVSTLVNSPLATCAPVEVTVVGPTVSLVQPDCVGKLGTVAGTLPELPFFITMTTARSPGCHPAGSATEVPA